MEIDFKSIIERLQDTGYPAEPDKVYIKIQNAENLLKRGLDYFTNKQAIWCEQNYRPIVDWMSDNKGQAAGKCL